MGLGDFESALAVCACIYLPGVICLAVESFRFKTTDVARWGLTPRSSGPTPAGRAMLPVYFRPGAASWFQTLRFNVRLRMCMRPRYYPSRKLMECWMKKLRQVFYLSRADAAITDQAVRQILLIAQRNNRQKDITGCLLYSGTHFAQILVGDPAVLDELVSRIRKDARHNSIVVAIDRETSIRKFPDWSMGILYKLDLADRFEALLSGEQLSEGVALELMNAVNPDTVMGSL